MATDPHASDRPLALSRARSPSSCRDSPWRHRHGSAELPAELQRKWDGMNRAGGWGQMDWIGPGPVVSGQGLETPIAFGGLWGRASEAKEAKLRWRDARTKLVGGERDCVPKVKR